MGAAMKRLRGRADGRRINELARDLLTDDDLKGRADGLQIRPGTSVTPIYV
jgi:hypothetical protein